VNVVANYADPNDLVNVVVNYVDLGHGKVNDIVNESIPQSYRR